MAGPEDLARALARSEQHMADMNRYAPDSDAWVQIPVSEFEALHSRIRELEARVERLTRALSHS